ncbi:MAG: hypothetical protein EA381_03475 [Planctomycetaceae bacterium]|nr:MAG: hypothetical protein EA381_03475 [Planctomycetaceae bacterium]
MNRTERLSSRSCEASPGTIGTRLTAVAEVVLLVLLFFAYRGDPPPGINEAHYLALAKNFWDPSWCVQDLFVTSDKTHLLFHATCGSLTQVLTLPAAAWAGRLIGWTLLAVALRGLCRQVFDRPYACLGVAMIWIIGLEFFHLAGEWVIGGIEAKVPAYGFVLAGMSRIARGDWPRVWPLLGLASAFHVLVGGWTVVAAGFAYWIVGRGESPLKAQLPWLVLGGLISLVGVWPALQASAGVAPADRLQAAKVYTYWRISHHLLPSAFPTVAYFRHIGLIAVTIAVAWPCRREPRFRGVFWLMIGCLAITACGLLVGLLPRFAPDQAANWLRFYWFRAGDAMVPLTLGLAVLARQAKAVGCPPGGTLPGQADAGGRFIGLAAGDRVFPLVAAIALSVFLSQEKFLPPAVRGFPELPQSPSVGRSARDVQRDWLDVCEWVRQALPPDEVLITPRHQQTFKWYAQRSEVVNWKDVPQDADSMLAWQRRFFDIFPQRLGTMRATIRYADLRRFGDEYGARFMLVDRRIVGPSLPLVQVYPPPASGAPGTLTTYAVYRLPR